MSDIKRVPARYIGSMQILLAPGQGTGLHADGSRRNTRHISTGDILLMPEQEVLGCTRLREGDRLLDLGTGKRVKPEHTGKSDQELDQLGYEFHQPRPDFEVVPDDEATQEVQRLTQIHNKALGLMEKTPDDKDEEA